MTGPGRIITVGSGKGGVGKSVMAANIAIALALTGQKVILVDADFGASNLHAILGISNPPYGFRDLFDKNHLTPEDLLIETGIGNLKFLSGAGDFPGSADITLKFQNRIINIIKNLEADVILMDLGPGTNFHIVDYFNMGTQQVVLSTPEMTSVMNTFSFLKAALFRKISQHFKSTSEIQHLVDISRNPELSENCYEIDTLCKKVEESHPQSLSEVSRIIHTFRPYLAMNRVRRNKDVLMAGNLQKLAHKYLNIHVKFLGYIVESDRVRDSVDEMIPFLIKDPQSKPSTTLQRVVSQLTNMDIHLVKRDGAIFISKQVKLTSGWDQ